MGCACKNKGSKQSSMSIDITLEPIDVVTKAITEKNQGSATTATKATMVSNDITVEPISLPPPESMGYNVNVKRVTDNSIPDSSVIEAKEIGLKQCYLCAKKHVERALEFFEEYHTGYPDYIKNLIESLRVSETDVMKAFIKWQRIMGQLNMGEGELLGKEPNTLTMRKEHVLLANKIRTERLKLSDDPLYVPDFESLLVDIHVLQHKVTENS